MDTKQDTQTTAPAEPSTIIVPVMDVQRPRQNIAVQDQSVVTSAPVLETPEIPALEEAETPFIEFPVPDTDQASEVALAPAEEAPAGNEPTPINNETGSIPATEEPIVDQAVQAPDEASPPAATTPDQSVTTPAQEPEHHKGPIGAVIAAIVFAVLLAGLTVFAYLQNKDSKTATNKANTSVQTAKVSGSDVDATNSQIDSSIQSADDAADFGTTDLSDSALGL